MPKRPHRGPGRPRNPVQRSHLLDLAAAAFAEQGYAGTSMSDVAARAGIRKASLFHHFDSKEALYLEVLGRILAGLGELVLDARLTEGPWLDRMDRLSALVTAFLGERPTAARLLLREVVGGGPFSAGPGRAVVGDTLRTVATFLEQGMSQGAIPRQDARHLAASIAGLHLTFFAAPEPVGELLGDNPFSSSQVEARAVAVTEQVRRLCGAGAWVRAMGPLQRLDGARPDQRVMERARFGPPSAPR